MNVNSAVGFSTPVPAKQRWAMRDQAVLFPAIGMLFGATGAASNAGRRGNRGGRFAAAIFSSPYEKAELAQLRVGGETRAMQSAR
jgi:cobalamin synthase